MKNPITIVQPIDTALESISKFEILSKEDLQFLEEKKEHLQKVFQQTYIWRTQLQKESIISDYYHPTLHSKFHQAILEQKVQTEQLFYLLKDIQLKKIHLKEILLNIKEIESKQEITEREEIELEKLYVERDFTLYELQQMRITVDYRMKEVKGWQQIQDNLIKKMKAEGKDDEYIWNKDLGEIEDFFFWTLNNYQGIKSSTDGGERNNLTALAVFAVKQAIELGLFETFLKRCTPIQLESLEMLGFIKLNKQEVNNDNKSTK